MKKNNLKYMFAAGIIAAFTACGSDNQGDTSGEQAGNDTAAVTHSQEENRQQTVYYQIPSPDEMFDFIKNGGLSFKSELLLPVENLQQYNTTLQQALIFGVYSADLAYTAAFEEYQTSLKYFGTVQKIAEQLGISSAYDASTAERIKNNLDNADSLVAVTGDTYFAVVDYLEQNNEEAKLGAIAAAGWVESMYIVLSLADETTNNEVLQRIKDQKLTFDNLYDYLQQHNDNQQVQEIVKLLEPLNDFFASIEEKEDAKTTFTKKNGKFVLGGDETVAPLTPEQLQELKNKITALRAQITQENV